MWSTHPDPAASRCSPACTWRPARRPCGTSRPPWSSRPATSERAATETATRTDLCGACVVGDSSSLEIGRIRGCFFGSNVLCCHQERFGARWTSSRLHHLQPTGLQPSPRSRLRTPLSSSPSTAQTTSPWCLTPSSQRYPATISPSSCGCAGGAPTSRRRLLNPEETARRRRRLCAAPSGTVRTETVRGSWGQLLHIRSDR